MVLRNSNIIVKLKETFIRTVEDKILYLDFSKEEKENYLKEKYNLSNVYNFDKELSNKIKALAILESNPDNYNEYSSEEKQKHNEQVYSMYQRIKSEEVYTGSDIRALSCQLYYEYHLIDENLEKYYKIIYNLWCYTGNGNYYTCDINTLQKFFELGIDLYLLTGVKCSILTKERDKIISAVNYFNLNYGEDYDIKNGEIITTDVAENKIHKQIENIISDVGGKTVLKLLFENELQNRYISELDRYIICKNKQFGKGDLETPIPYNYLIQICLKHLDKPFAPLLTTKIETAYRKLIDDSQYFIDLLGVYSTNPLSETQFDALYLIDFIADNTVFENLCIPSQYSKQFIECILKNIYEPEYQKLGNCPQLYKSKSFLKLISAILSESPCSIITYKKLSSKVHLSKTIIKDFLEHFSIESKDSNSEYKNIYSPTTSQHFPLVKLNSDSYFYLSSQFSGYAFCNKIQDVLHSREFSRGLGNRLDSFVKKLLDEKQYSYKHGTYAPKITKKEGECDLILEDDKRIVFIEIKNCGLPYEFEVADLVTILKCLGEGMLKAQQQILHHKLHLIENNQEMLLYVNKNDPVPKYILDNTNNKRIYSISLCGSEYAFFTSGIIARCLTENIANLTFHAYDKSRDKELDNLNKLSIRFRALIEEYSKHKDGLTIDDLFFCSTFKTLQQFFIALNLSKNINELIDFLTFDTYMIFPYFDFYVNLLCKIKMKKSTNKSHITQ